MRSGGRARPAPALDHAHRLRRKRRSDGPEIDSNARTDRSDEALASGSFAALERTHEVDALRTFSVCASESSGGDLPPTRRPLSSGARGVAATVRHATPTDRSDPASSFHAASGPSRPGRGPDRAATGGRAGTRRASTGRATPRAAPAAARVRRSPAPAGVTSCAASFAARSRPWAFQACGRERGLHEVLARASPPSQGLPGASERRRGRPPGSAVRSIRGLQPGSGSGSTPVSSQLFS